MRVIVHLVGANGSCAAKTDNGLLLAFRVTDDTSMRPGDAFDIELPGLLESRAIRRVADGKAIPVSLQRHDIHDLRTVGAHGTPSDVSDERMRSK